MGAAEARDLRHVYVHPVDLQRLLYFLLTNLFRRNVRK